MINQFGMSRPFLHQYELPASNSGPMFWFIFRGNELYLQARKDKLEVPLSDTPPVEATAISYSRIIGRYGSTPCMVVEINDTGAGETFKPVSLRQAHAHLGGDLWILAGRASQILRWQLDHRFCGRCGSPMREEPPELLRKCTGCSMITYPRLSPAVIMSVIKGDQILLGRAPRFPPGVYSVLAGFVEPGETLEEAVHREVGEEVNIEIEDIRYIGSQPWPFPHSLMIGFSARYAAGEIRVDGDELEDAGWFSRDNLPRLPTKISIARKLIDLYLDDAAEM